MHHQSARIPSKPLWVVNPELLTAFDAGHRNTVTLATRFGCHPRTLRRVLREAGRILPNNRGGGANPLLRAWCPPERLSEYRKLRRCLGAEAAREAIQRG